MAVNYFTNSVLRKKSPCPKGDLCQPSWRQVYSVSLTSEEYPNVRGLRGTYIGKPNRARDTQCARGFSFTPSFISSPIAKSSVVTKDLNLKVEKERRATEGDSNSSEHPPSHLLLFFFLFSPSHFTASLHFSIIARAPLRTERGPPPACGLLLFISFVFPSHN